MNRRFTPVLALCALLASAAASPAVAGPSGGPAPHVSGRHAAFGSNTGAQSVRPSAQIDRLKGANRYDTSAVISYVTYPNATWPDGAPVERAFIASGAKFPDALALGPLASVYGPILLVPATGTLPTSVRQELDRLAPQEVTVIGGTSTVSTAMAQQVAAPGRNVSRIAGTNRYDTGAQITSEYVDDLAGINVNVDTLFVTSGRNYADALGGGAAAANVLAGLLLTDPASLSPETAAVIQDVDPSTVVLLGGTSSVSDAVKTQIASLAPNASIQRLSGPDRFATAAATANWLAAAQGPPQVAFVTIGTNFPDALAAAPMSAMFASPVVLSRATCLSKPTNTFINTQQPEWVVGVGGGVSEEALRQTSVCPS